MIENFKTALIKLRAWMLAVLLIVIMASCIDDSENPNVQPVPVAYVSLYHASPDAPGLDVLVDNRLISYNTFDYTDYSGYLNFYTGNRNIRFNTFNASNALIDTTYNFEAGKTYSVFVIDKLTDIEALIVRDSAAAPAEGKAMVRFVHLSPDAVALSAVISGEASSLFAERSFKDVSNFVEVDAKEYAFEVKGSGVDITTNKVNLVAGRYYTILVRGFAEPPSGNQNVISVEVL
jgi:hypothetical protein